MNKLKKYLQNVYQELKKVTWPSRKQAGQMTLVVVGASLVVGIYIGALDYLFTQILSLVVR